MATYVTHCVNDFSLLEKKNPDKSRLKKEDFVSTTVESTSCYGGREELSSRGVREQLTLCAVGRQGDRIADVRLPSSLLLVIQTITSAPSVGLVTSGWTTALPKCVCPGGFSVKSS